MIKFYKTEINIEFFFFFYKSHAFAWITLNIKSCKPQTYQKQNKTNKHTTETKAQTAVVLQK